MTKLENESCLQGVVGFHIYSNCRSIVTYIILHITLCRNINYLRLAGSSNNCRFLSFFILSILTDFLLWKKKIAFI